jgi:hypothetical protein
MAAKVAYVDGLDELEKLEKQAGGTKFKLFVPRASTTTGNKPFRVWSTVGSGGVHMVVIGTASLIAVAKMKPGEHVPAGAVTTTYFKI